MTARHKGAGGYKDIDERKRKTKRKRKRKRKREKACGWCSGCLESRPPPFAVSSNEFPAAPFVIHIHTRDTHTCTATGDIEQMTEERCKDDDIEYLTTSVLSTLCI